MGWTGRHCTLLLLRHTIFLVVGFCCLFFFCYSIHGRSFHLVWSVAFDVGGRSGELKRPPFSPTAYGRPPLSELTLNDMFTRSLSQPQQLQLNDRRDSKISWLFLPFQGRGEIPFAKTTYDNWSLTSQNDSPFNNENLLLYGRVVFQSKQHVLFYKRKTRFLGTTVFGGMEVNVISVKEEEDVR